MADTRGGSTLLKTEDWLAVWLGFLIIVLVLAGVRPDMPKFRWATDGGFAATVAEQKPAVDKLAKDAEAKGEKDLAGAAAALAAAVGAGDRAAIGSAAKKLGEAAGKAQDAGLKKKGGDLGRKIAGDASLVGLDLVHHTERVWPFAVVSKARTLELLGQ